MTKAMASRCQACALYICHASPRTPDSGFMAVMVQRKTRPLGDRTGPIASSQGQLVQSLQQVVGGQLDLLVPPLGRPVQAGDDAHPVDAPEIPVDKGVPGLGFVGSAVGQAEMPPGVLLPRVPLQVGVVVGGSRLDLPQSLSSTYWRLSIRRSACVT